MRPRLNVNEIEKSIRARLPDIDNETFQNRFCTKCPYYAKRVNRSPKCMLTNCAWDDDSELFSPVLMDMFPILDARVEIAKMIYLEALRNKDILQSMFAKELEEAKKKDDICTDCPYGKHSPCIGFCYKQMTANPVERRKENANEHCYADRASDERSTVFRNHK